MWPRLTRFVRRHDLVVTIAPALGFVVLVAFREVPGWRPHGISTDYLLMAYVVAWALVAPRGLLIFPMLAAASGVLVLMTPEPVPCPPPPAAEEIRVMTSCMGPWQANLSPYLFVLAIASLVVALLRPAAVSVRRRWMS